MDTCISIYTTINRLGIDWRYRKEDIVLVYKQYLRLMDHWRDTLPASQMLEVRYEDLILDSERVIREMVGFCNLEWEDACLRPELNPNPVATPSAWQVRQPMYRSSIGRWRNYEPWLGEFAALLGVPGVHSS